jgi:hypothetical protein
MKNLSPKLPLFEALEKKATLKQNVFNNTLETFKLFHASSEQIVKGFQKHKRNTKAQIAFECKKKGEFEFELKFAGDVLIFLMHSNVFEIPRNHQLMQTSYLKEDNERSFCGIINIYNFLSDSFKYKRINDVGYLIGRVFINKDKHYFIEGKREMGLLYNNFNTAEMGEKPAHEIVDSAIHYTLNFDLLTPPFKDVQEIPVYDIQTTLDNITLKTGKRLGFKFQADEI